MKKVIVCVNYRANPQQPSCAARGGEQIADLIERGIAEENIDVALERFKCLGRCNEGPNLRMAPGGEFYSGVRPEDIPGLLEKIRDFVSDGN